MLNKDSINKKSSQKKNHISRSRMLQQVAPKYEDTELIRSVSKGVDGSAHSFTPVDVLTLQQGIGNNAVQRLLKSKQNIGSNKPSHSEANTQALQLQDEKYGESFSVQYDVQIVPQTSNMSCWAASAAMLISWRDSISIDDTAIAAGINYWSQYLNGLDPEDVHMFREWGLTEEEPQSFTIQAYRDMLEAYGPLWVAADADSSAGVAPHIRVITGIYGDGTPTGTFFSINDPAGGRTYTESVATFADAQTELAESELNFDRPLYLAHL